MVSVMSVNNYCYCGGGTRRGILHLSGGGGRDSHGTEDLTLELGCDGKGKTLLFRAIYDVCSPCLIWDTGPGWREATQPDRWLLLHHINDLQTQIGCSVSSGNPPVFL